MGFGGGGGVLAPPGPPTYAPVAPPMGSVGTMFNQNIMDPRAGVTETAHAAARNRNRLAPHGLRDASDLGRMSHRVRRAQSWVDHLEDLYRYGSAQAIGGVWDRDARQMW